MHPILFIGSHAYDLEPLAAVATRARERLGRDALVATIAPAEAVPAARAVLDAHDLPMLDTRVVAPPRPARNPLVRARRWRDENRAIVAELIRAVRPAAVVADVNPPPNLLLDGFARHGVPTVLLQLWFWGDRAFQRAWRADDRRAEEADWPWRRRLRSRAETVAERAVGIRPHAPWNVGAATIAVQGPALARRLVADGAAADRVVVTGNPVLDELHRLAIDPDPAVREVRSRLGVPPSVPIVTYMRGHDARLTLDPAIRRDSQAKILAALAAGAPGARIVVKVHPKEGEAERRLVRELDPRATVVGTEVDTDALIAASALTVGTFSTTLLQSVALDRPTVSAVLLPGLDYWRRVTTWSGVERVDTAEALAEAVRRHLRDPAHQATWAARRAAFRRDELLLDGRGTERVVDLVASMIDRAATPSTRTAQ